MWSKHIFYISYFLITLKKEQAMVKEHIHNDIGEGMDIYGLNNKLT